MENEKWSEESRTESTDLVVTKLVVRKFNPLDDYSLEELVVLTNSTNMQGSFHLTLAS